MDCTDSQNVIEMIFLKKKFRLKFIRSSGRLNNTPHPPPPSMAMSLFLVPMTMSLYMANGLLQMWLHYDLEIRLPWVGAYVIIRVPLSGRQEAQVALVVKSPSPSEGDIREPGFHPWVGKIPWRKDPLKDLQEAPSWRRKRQPMPVFLLGDSHGQRSLLGYSP